MSTSASEIVGPLCQNRKDVETGTRNFFRFSYHGRCDVHLGRGLLRIERLAVRLQDVPPGSGIPEWIILSGGSSDSPTGNLALSAFSASKGISL